MNNSRYWQAKKATFIGAVVNIILALMKLTGGFFWNSHALIADGVHSLSDLMIDMMVVIASKYGSQVADDSHPYGHQRIETAATLLLALFLILAGFGICWDAIEEIIRASTDIPKPAALSIAIFSIFANEILFYYTRHVAQKIQSPLLIANAWHHRSDALASLVVSAGILGSLLGYHFFDTLAAVFVGLMIIKMGIQYGWGSVKELVDTAVDNETLSRIEHIILAVDGVEKIHQLRTRFMGKDILIDVHILVAPTISVSEGHYIALQVHQSLLKSFEKINDVIVHVDPEEDEITSPALLLPSRKFLEDGFIKPLQREFPNLIDCTIHYLDGVLLLDLILDKTQDSMLKQLQSRVCADLQNYACIKRVRVLSSTAII